MEGRITIAISTSQISTATAQIQFVVEYIDRDHDNGWTRWRSIRIQRTAGTSERTRFRRGGRETSATIIGFGRQLSTTGTSRRNVNSAATSTATRSSPITCTIRYQSAGYRAWENPFAFYDEDRDGIAEVVIRFSGKRDRVENMRYSFDADNDATRATQHNYDFGFTCVTSRKDGDDRTLPLHYRLTESITLHGLPAGPVLGWQHAESSVRRLRMGSRSDVRGWKMTDNVDSRPDGDPHSRWEGVIASGYRSFAAGGRPTRQDRSMFVTRLTCRQQAATCSCITHRSIIGFICVAQTKDGPCGLNRDGKVDFSIVVCRWGQRWCGRHMEVDLNGDGTFDRTVHQTYKPRAVPLRYHRLQPNMYRFSERESR